MSTRLKSAIWIGAVLGTLVAISVVFAALGSSKPVSKAPTKIAHASPSNSLPGTVPAHAKLSVWNWPAKMWREFIAKVDHMRDLDQKVDFLREKLAEVELENAALMHEYVSCSEKSRADQLKAQARLEGGTETARTVASLRPSSRYASMLKESPAKILELASKAFSARDYESAARGYSHVIEELGDSELKTAQTYYLGAVSLYQLGNYKRAKFYFERALELADPGQITQTGQAALDIDQPTRGRAIASADVTDISYAPRSLSWIALCSAKLGDKSGRDQAIQDLIQKYPKSNEARRLNRTSEMQR